MKYLVTGGTGFFGCHMCKYLVSQGQDVIAFDILPFAEEDVVEGVEVILGDVRNLEQVASALQDVDIVIHAAAVLALEPRDTIVDVNFKGTVNVIKQAVQANCKKFIFIGSTAVYGVPEHHPISEQDALNPIGYYGIAKYLSEQYIKSVTGIDSIIIRPKSFIGSGRLGIFQILFDWIECGKNIYVFGDGKNKFQLLSVLDLVEAVYLSTIKAEGGCIYNIGAAEFSTVNDDLGQLLQYANTGSKIRHIPSEPAKLCCRLLSAFHLSPIYSWVYETADKDSFLDVDKAKKELGFIPKYSNHLLMKKTYDWYLTPQARKKLTTQGTSHRVSWKQGALKLLKLIS